MAKEITKPIEQEEWYQALIDDCQALLTEGIWNYRLTLIKTYHLLGKRILEENDNFKREKIYGERICNTVAQSLGKSSRTIYQAIQFAKKYPNLDKLPEGKNISWHKICNQLLSAGEIEAHKCQWETIERCKICRKIKKDISTP